MTNLVGILLKVHLGEEGPVLEISSFDLLLRASIVSNGNLYISTISREMILTVVVLAGVH